MVVDVHDKSVVTTGRYDSSLIKNGKTFDHILDVHTGYPVKADTASLTIIADLSVDGEIWTTRLFGKTTEEIIGTLNQLSNIEGVVINDKGEVFYSCGMNELIL